MATPTSSPFSHALLRPVQQIWRWGGQTFSSLLPLHTVRPDNSENPGKNIKEKKYRRALEFRTEKNIVKLDEQTRFFREGGFFTYRVWRIASSSLPRQKFCFYPDSFYLGRCHKYLEGEVNPSLLFFPYILTTPKIPKKHKRKEIHKTQGPSRKPHWQDG